MPDHSPQKAEKETPQKAGTLTVGAVNDHAERDADQRADAALSWLAGLQPGGSAPAPEPHIHTAACGIGRSHDPDAGGTIGAAGGALDSDTSDRIRRMKGGGERLSGDVRTTMEAAFGTDLGKVRVHRGSEADKLSRSISAEAFTTGNDIFFSSGAYDPSSARGQRVLAHELGHVLQGGDQVGRWFTKQTPEEKQAAKEKAAREKSEKEEKARKKQAEKEEKARQKREAKEQEEKRQATLKQKRTLAKETDKNVRTEAKQVNKEHKRVTEQVKTSYEKTEDSWIKAPVELTTLQQRFETLLQDERDYRLKLIAKYGGPEKADMTLVETMVDEYMIPRWDNAGKDVRALRPLRYDQFDKALNEVRQLKSADLDEESFLIDQVLKKNEEDLGPLMKESKARKKVREQREQARQQVRLQNQRNSENDDPNAPADSVEAEIMERLEKKFAEKKAEREKQGYLSTYEADIMKATLEKKIREEEFGEDPIEEHRDNLDIASTVIGVSGKATKTIGKTVVPKFGVAKDSTGVQATQLTGMSIGAISQVLDLVSEILTFIMTIREISRGTADKGAKLRAAREFLGILQAAGKLTRTALKATQKGVKAFEPANQAVLDNVTQALPIVGIVTSTLGIIDGAMELVPLAERHVDGVAGSEEALLADQVPLAASYDRINSRNAQLIEKSAFGIGKNVTLLGLSITEVATVGGFGVPAGAKIGVTLIDVLHKIGHGIYDTVNEHKSANAIRNFDVKKQEGASRDVIKYDVGSSVDVLIVAAKKNNSKLARQTLTTYGVTEQEIDSMWFVELREKVIKGLKAAKDPKTVGDKINEVKDKVKDALGGDTSTKIVGEIKPKKSTWQKITGKVKSAGSAIAGIPQKMRDNWANAKLIADSKNEIGYGDPDKKRGGGSTLYYALRTSDRNEKSLQRVRQRMKALGKPLDQLPRTTDDLKARKKIEDSKEMRTKYEKELLEKTDTKLIVTSPYIEPELRTFAENLLNMSDEDLHDKHDKLVNLDSKEPMEIMKVRLLAGEMTKRKWHLENQQAKANPKVGV